MSSTVVRRSTMAALDRHSQDGSPTALAPRNFLVAVPVNLDALSRRNSPSSFTSSWEPAEPRPCPRRHGEVVGVTLHGNSPAEGLWCDDGEIERDRIVVAELMTPDLDRTWWSSYRKELEARFRQEEIVIRVIGIERL
ncbi:hypothetical protein [Rhizobium leguminosarum]|uniref:hypothetical protein n=1 Tax=Rhizobium leguminosarum TaxID=384 RepID=UPI003D7C1DFB